jgi:hypothetical protein
MFVVGERFGDAEPTHHLKRDMVDDPGLARLTVLVPNSGRLPVILRRNDQLLTNLKGLSQGTDITAKSTSSACVAAFQKNERGC